MKRISVSSAPGNIDTIAGAGNPIALPDTVRQSTLSRTLSSLGNTISLRSTRGLSRLRLRVSSAFAAQLQSSIDISIEEAREDIDMMPDPPGQLRLSHQSLELYPEQLFFVPEAHSRSCSLQPLRRGQRSHRKS